MSTILPRSVQSLLELRMTTDDMQWEWVLVVENELPIWANDNLRDQCKMHGIWYGVCIYKGAKGVMSAIFDMNMELYHMIMMLKRWCFDIYLNTHLIMFINVHIFGHPKKRLLKLTWFQGHELRNRRLPEGRVPQVLGATWRWSTSGCFVSPSPGPSFSHQKILTLL